MDFANVFKALGDETRVRILNLLLQSKQSLCVCEIVDALLLPQYKISRALSMMKSAGLTTFQQRGTWVYYKANPTPTACLQELFHVIEKHFKDRFPDDLARLNKRLSLREGGKCIIGFALKDKII